VLRTWHLHHDLSNVTSREGIDDVSDDVDDTIVSRNVSLAHSLAVDGDEALIEF